jgi:uncharacterized protein
VASILNTYSIHFKGLKVGKHTFNFEVDNAFFEAFEESEIKHGKLDVDVKLNKQNQMIDLNITIDGTVEVTCDRCLEEFDIPISYEGSLYVKFSETRSEEDSEIIILSTDDSEINISQYIYESICLSLPIQRYHGMKGTKSKCNKEMLAKLKSLSVKNAKKENSDEIDPRWSKLKDIELN